MDDRDDRARGPGETSERGDGHVDSAGLGAATHAGEPRTAEDGFGADPEPADGPERGALPTAGADGVRISAVEAAVAAGLVPSTTREREVRSRAADETATDERRGVLELPDWSDPPTGQVPRVLLGPDDEPSGAVPAVRGPSWREDRVDWEEEVDLSFLLGEDEGAAASGAAAEVEDDLDDDTWAALLGGFLPPPGASRAKDPEPVVAERAVGDAAPGGVPGRSPGRRPGARRGGPRAAEPSAGTFAGEPSPNWARRDRRRRTAGPTRPARRSGHDAAPDGEASGEHGMPARATGRSAVVATATGLVAGGVALGCLVAGPVAALVLVAVVVTLAAGEAFGALRRSGHHPATPLGLLAVPAMLVAAYLRGPRGVVVALAAAVLLGFVWHLVASGRRPAGAKGLVTDLGGTLLVVCWVGLLGSFAGLLLDPAAFPHRHGVAYLAAVVACSAAADVGAYATGAKLGRHPLAPRISPHKSIEGLVGGTVLALAVAGLAIVHLHPFDVGLALAVGAAVAVLAPIGDLAESLVKRDLGVKDMGNLLPAHGGVLDRVDAMLFVLPAAYVLARVVHP